MTNQSDRQMVFNALMAAVEDVGILDIVDIEAVFENLPPTDVQPVQHGHWIKDGHHITCDQCGQSMCDKDREGDTIPQNFCPNCGVRMGGEQE